MKKAILTATILASISIYSQTANAALVNGSTLNFTAASSGNATSLPAVGSGSWFTLEPASGSFNITGISSFDGLVLGSTQSTTTAATGNIDNPWMFSASQGVHQSTSNTNVLSATGDTATIDFSGWGIFWNGSATDLSSGTSNGIATITCDTGSGCANGAGYVLDYLGATPADPTGKGSVNYTLHLEGTISAVPVPAAVWLFASGLIGLIGTARKRKH